MSLDPYRYFDNYKNILNDENVFSDLQEFASGLKEVRNSGKRLVFAGNGASSAISSHAALDFTKQGKLESLTFSDPALMSAFSNDYGYENALAEMFRCYRREGDIVILVSTSGNSPNVVQLARCAKEMGHMIVSFTGKDHSNDLKLISDTSFWVNSHAYNIVENVHMMWLGYLIDCLVGAEVYAVS